MADSGPNPLAPNTHLGMIAVVVAMVLGTLAIVFDGGPAAGDPMATASYYDPDTRVYLAADFLQVQDSQQLERFMDAIGRIAEASGAGPGVDGDRLDYWSEWDISVSADILPWLGRSGSVGLVPDPSGPIEFTRGTNLAPLFVVQSGNRENAERFVEKILTSDAERTGSGLTGVPFGDETVTAWEYTSGDHDAMTWAVTDGAILIAPSAGVIASALETKASGISLRDSEGFQAVIDTLPSDPGVTAYISGTVLEDLYNEFVGLYGELGIDDELGLDPLAVAADDPVAMGASASLDDGGLTFTFTQILDAPVTGQSTEPTPVAESLPDGTLAYLAWNTSPGTLGDFGELLAATDPDAYDEMVFLAEIFLGVDVFTDVLAYMGGGSSIALIDTGPPESIFDIERIGFLGSIGIHDIDAMAATLSTVTSYMEDVWGFSFTEVGGVTRALDPSGSDFSFYLSDQAFVFGVPTRVVESSLQPPETALADGEMYQRIARGLMGSGVDFYLDLHGLFDASEEQLDEEQEAWLTMFPGLGVAVDSDGRTTTITVFVAADY